MKIRVVVTVNIPEEEVEKIFQAACTRGHDFGKTTNKRKVIKRALESAVMDEFVKMKEEEED